MSFLDAFPFLNDFTFILFLISCGFFIRIGMILMDYIADNMRWFWERGLKLYIAGTRWGRSCLAVLAQSVQIPGKTVDSHSRRLVQSLAAGRKVVQIREDDGIAALLLEKGGRV